MVVAALLLVPTAPQQLGYGGLPGQRTPRTGSVWPVGTPCFILFLFHFHCQPFSGAGQGYWARQAGHYRGRRATTLTLPGTSNTAWPNPVFTALP